MGGNRWFDDAMRTDILGILAAAQRKTDAVIFAYIVMHNHLHIIVQQGTDPLWRLMQPVCRSIALRVQRVRNRRGYVFERRFRDRQCRSPRHLRNAIVYVHRNPVKARLCSHPDDYWWSSQHVYSTTSPDSVASADLPHVTSMLELFGSRHNMPLAELRANYSAYADWWDHCKRLGPDVPHPVSPNVAAGNDYWHSSLGRPPRPSITNQARPDLRDLVLRVIHEVAPGLELDYVTSHARGRVLAEIRKISVKRAQAFGYRGAAVARFLNISDATVSSIARAL